jgi:hypothetical protein
VPRDDLACVAVCADADHGYETCLVGRNQYRDNPVMISRPYAEDGDECSDGEVGNVRKLETEFVV